MINEHVLDLASTIAKDITDSKWKTFPTEDSPLYGLVQANIGESYYQGGHLTLENIVSDSLNQDAGGSSIHTELLNETVDHVAKVINGNLALVKTKVTPMFMELHDRFNDELANTPKMVGIPVVIKPNAYHRLWGQLTLQNMFSTYSKTPLAPFKATVTFPELTGEELSGLMKTGISSVDTAITDWVSDQPTDKLINVYNRFFRIHRGDTNRESNYPVVIGRAIPNTHVTLDGFDRNDYMMAYLIAHNFIAELPAGMEGNAVMLENYLVQMRATLGRVLFAVFDDRELTRKSKSLVFKYDVGTNHITGKKTHILNVNQDVLLDFYEAGGSPEILFGAAVSNFGFDIDKMLASAESLKLKWNASLTAHTLEVNANMFTIKRGALRSTLTNLISETPADDLPGPLEEVLNRARELTSELRPGCFEDTESVLQNIICDVFFPDTNAKIVIQSMEETARENPDMTARECALYAEFDLLAKWLASQIQCAKA